MSVYVFDSPAAVAKSREASLKPTVDISATGEGYAITATHIAIWNLKNILQLCDLGLMSGAKTAYGCQ